MYLICGTFLQSRQERWNQERDMLMQENSLLSHQLMERDQQVQILRTEMVNKFYKIFIR